MTQRDLFSLSSTQIIVGLSQVIRVTPSANQYAEQFSIRSGGSLEIVPVQFSGSSSAAGSAWGKGYLVGATEVVKISGPAAFYLAATGSTVTVNLLLGYTAGATLL